MKKVTVILLSLIVAVGGFMRIYNLSNSPPSLNWDEAALGYNAYSVSKTLKDEYNKRLPLFTRSFDEYKSMIPVYMMIPSIYIFGLNEVGVRFPSAFLGMLSIILVFLVAKEFFKDEKTSLVCALIFAVEPWTVELSRVYQEASTALFFLLTGLLLYLYSKKLKSLLPLSVISFGISMFTYNSNKILVPLYLLILFLAKRNIAKIYPKKIKLIGLTIALLIISLFLFFVIKGEAFARVSSTNIFILWPTTQVLKPLIETHRLSQIGAFLLHNNYFYFSWEVVGRYLSYFSPINLFVREPLEPSTKVPDSSVFYAFEFIPWLIGLYIVLKNRKQISELFYLMLISPIPAVFTWNWFQPGRVMTLLFVYSLLIGAGLVRIIDLLSTYLYKIVKVIKFKIAFIQKILYLSLVIFCLISAFYLFDAINVQLPIRDSGNWQPGFRGTVPVVMRYTDQYKQVVIETPHAQPYIFYLFYGAYDPAKYQRELNLEKIGVPRKVYDFGKFEFRKIDWEKDRSMENTLFVGNDDNLPQERVGSDVNVTFVYKVQNNFGDTIAKLVGTK